MIRGESTRWSGSCGSSERSGSGTRRNGSHEHTQAIGPNSVGPQTSVIGIIGLIQVGRLVVGTSDSASEKDQFLADALFLLSKAPVNSEGSTAESPNHLRNFDPTRCIMIRTFY